MRNTFFIFALAAILLLPGGTIIAADEATTASESQATVADSAEPADAAAESPAAEAPAPESSEPESMEPAEDFDEFVGQYPDEQYLTVRDAPYEPWLATRFGWWGLSTSGSPYGVGEWQGLNTSTPFWDVDGITSDGQRTIDFFATGPEDEANQAGLYFYGGPGLAMDVEYNRFIHRLGHEPYQGPAGPDGFPPEGGFYGPTPLQATVAGHPMWGQDLNLGQDYALRVQQLKANFKGNLTENLSWGLNVWGMRKEGMRQTNSSTHCFDAAQGPDADASQIGDNVTGAGNTCHVVSRGQYVDWLTMELEPVITARFGWLTLEYSRTMRTFQQGDGIVTYRNTRGSPFGVADFEATGIEAAYGYASENYTEIDRLKVLADVAPSTDLYVLGFVGNTHNTFRESDRKFYGVDARLTNSTFDGLTATVYGKTFTQNNSADTLALNARYPTQANLWVEPVPPQQNVSAQSPPALLVDRVYSAVGVKGRWRPFHDSCGWARRLAVVGGYEYSQMSRDNVTYALIDAPAESPFTQPDTATNMAFVGLQQDLTRTLNAYVRYRMIATSYPLLGVSPWANNARAAINSLLPEHEDRIEIGGNWNPTETLLLNASFWIQNTYNHSDGFVDFDEDNYPIVLSAAYTPDERWAFTGGYATFSNWISQDITLSSDVPFTSEWDYAGRADVFSLGASYAWTCRMRLTGGVEYVRSRNVITDVPSSPEALAAGNPYTDIPGYSAVRVNTWRLTGGVDYELSQNMNTFFRYNFFDYGDRAMLYNAGTAHMFLAGLSGVF